MEEKTISDIIFEGKGIFIIMIKTEIYIAKSTSSSAISITTYFTENYFCFS